MNLFTFMNSVTNRRAREKAAATEAAKASEIKTKTARVSYIPFIALSVANLIVLTLDYRVFDAVYKITASYILSAFSIIPTGVMFILWFDVLYGNYPLSTEWQKRISLAGAGLALIAASAFAFFDYGLTVDIGHGLTVGADYKMAFWMNIVLTVIHGVALFWWYAIDEEVMERKANEKDLAAQRRKADAQEAQSRITLEMMETANKVLDSMQAAMTRQQTLEDVYGKEEVAKMLALLAGLETATGKDLDGNGVIGSVNNPAAVRQYQQNAQAVDANFTQPSTQKPRP